VLVRVRSVARLPCATLAVLSPCGDLVVPLRGASRRSPRCSVCPHAAAWRLCGSAGEWWAIYKPVHILGRYTDRLRVPVGGVGDARRGRPPAGPHHGTGQSRRRRPVPWSVWRARGQDRRVCQPARWGVARLPRPVPGATARGSASQCLSLANSGRRLSTLRVPRVHGTPFSTAQAIQTMDASHRVRRAPGGTLKMVTTWNSVQPLRGITVTTEAHRETFQAHARTTIRAYPAVYYLKHDDRGACVRKQRRCLEAHELVVLIMCFLFIGPRAMRRTAPGWPPRDGKTAGSRARLLPVGATQGPDRGSASDQDCMRSEGLQGILHRKNGRKTYEWGMPRYATLMGETNRGGAACVFQLSLKVGALHQHSCPCF